jgi:hypothetical protein
VNSISSSRRLKNTTDEVGHHTSVLVWENALKKLKDMKHAVPQADLDQWWIDGTHQPSIRVAIILPWAKRTPEEFKDYHWEDAARETARIINVTKDDGLPYKRPAYAVEGSSKDVGAMSAAVGPLQRPTKCHQCGNAGHMAKECKASHCKDCGLPFPDVKARKAHFGIKPCTVRAALPWVDGPMGHGPGYKPAHQEEKKHGGQQKGKRKSGNPGHGSEQQHKKKKASEGGDEKFSALTAQVATLTAAVEMLAKAKKD